LGLWGAEVLEEVPTLTHSTSSWAKALPLAAKKLIVYIDQALISNIVKAKEGSITRPDLIALFEVLNMGMRAEKIVCPRSWFHREEGSLTSLDSAIQRYLRFISQLDFEPPFELEKRQFFNAACAFLGHAPLYTGWKECLESDPDARLRRFRIDANMPMDIFNFRERRQYHADELNRVRREVKGRTYAAQLQIERAEVPAYLHSSYGWGTQHLFTDTPGGLETYKAFLATDLATSVTALDLFSQLCASLLVRYNDREVQTGDVTDMKILSNLLPYCHVMTTDKFMKELVRVLKFDERFGTRVFSGTPDDIAALTEYLTQLVASHPAANVPALSLLIVPDAQIKEHLWDFFRALMLGVGKWTSKMGGWIELVNVNDGGYPIYAHQSGLPLPDPSFFFEFDDEIESGGRNLVDLARGLRADVAVVVDSYHVLQKGFLDAVFAAVESRAASIPQYG
jgi:hypothetical protein